MPKQVLSIVLVFLAIQVSAQPFRSLHRKAVVIDTHNDFISKNLEYGLAFDSDLRGKTHSDLKRMTRGGVDIQIFSVWGDEHTDFAHANREIDSLEALIARNPLKMMMIRSSNDVTQALREKKFGVMIGVEGGHLIGDDLSNLEKLYERGARYMTLTWNNSTSWASSALDETSGKITQENKGLNEFGVSVVRKMNELGMMVDLSHVGEQTFLDAMSVVTKPVIVSHSCVHALCPVPRNLKDYQLSALKQNGGVVCLNFFSAFIDSSFRKRNEEFLARHKAEIDSLEKAGMTPFFLEDYMVSKYSAEAAGMRPPMSILLDHIDHIVKKIGVDHVGLGSDFDGITSAPRELRGVEDFPRITKALKKRGYSRSDIRKILGANVLRVFKANENG